MKKARLITIAFMLTAITSWAQQSVVFNELMQSNINCLMVENDFPDSWVELYNPNEAPVNLANYSIGVNADPTQAYHLPATRISIPAHGYLVIYCDKVGKGLHTNFRIDSGKGALLLFDPNGNIVDEMTFSAMPAPDVAYGRTSDGAEEWYYEFSPTPGSANAGGGSNEVLPEPVFTTPGGICNDYTSVTIEMPAGVPDDAFIHFTLDGKEPTMSSPSVKQLNMSITSTKIFRARIFSHNSTCLPSPIVTNSYIYHPREVTMPIVSIVGNEDHFYDTTVGIFSNSVNDGMPNYMRKWRRPINIEMTDPTQPGKQVFNQLAETAVGGVSTREEAQKSMKVYANKRFGKKNFKAQLWTDKPNVKKVKSFTLRNGGNNSSSSRINDAVVQRLFGTHIDNLDWQAYRPVIVYLNGKYLGEYGLRERSDEDYIEANYDGLEDIELADENSYQDNVKGTLFADFRSAYQNDRTTYAELAEKMDMDNFMEVLIAEIYGANTDYPTNNVAMWRPTADDGKWRWILKDMDRFAVSMPLYPTSFDMFRYLFEPDDLMYGGMHHFDIYKKVISYDEFRNEFINRMAIYLGDFLKPSSSTALFDEMAEEIKEEVKATFSKYNLSFSNFTTQCQYARNIIAGRNNFMYNQMGEFFKLGKPLPLKVETQGMEVSINGIKLIDGDFDGAYYPELPLSVATESLNCKWTMLCHHSSGNVEEYELGSNPEAILLGKYLVDTFDNATFTLKACGSDGIESAEYTSSTYEPTAIYDISGTRLTSLKNGINIIKLPNGEARKIIFHNK